MSPFDEAIRKRDAMLVEELRDDLGVNHRMRLFESAEGIISPLTIEESKAAAEEVREAIARTTVTEASTDSHTSR